MKQKKEKNSCWGILWEVVIKVVTGTGKWDLKFQENVLQNSCGDIFLKTIRLLHEHELKKSLKSLTKNHKCYCPWRAESWIMKKSEWDVSFENKATQWLTSASLKSAAQLLMRRIKMTTGYVKISNGSSCTHRTQFYCSICYPNLIFHSSVHTQWCQCFSGTPRRTTALLHLFQLPYRKKIQVTDDSGSMDSDMLFPVIQVDSKLPAVPWGTVRALQWCLLFQHLEIWRLGCIFVTFFFPCSANTQRRPHIEIQ